MSVIILSRVAHHIDYIDYDVSENNIFEVVNQYSIQYEHLRRPDMLLYINGIPVDIFEFKTAIEEDTTIHDTWKQITIRNCWDIPKLMMYCFLSVICDGVRYLTWQYFLMLTSITIYGTSLWRFDTWKRINANINLMSYK